MSRPAPRSWSPSPALVRAVLKGHSGLGLAFAAILYLVCLTGALAVFVHEFERWENPWAPRVERVSAAALQRAVAEAAHRTGQPPEHVYIDFPSEDAPFLRVRTEDAQRRLRGWYADETGALRQAFRDSWSRFLVDLHINLHLPRTWGMLLVGLAGVALLSSLISGILAHPRILRDAFHLRLGGSRRLQEADLHNRIGVWALPFHVVVSLTGALLGLSTIIIGALGLAVFQGDTQKVYALFTPPHPAEDARPAPLIDLRPMVAEIARRAPAGRIDYVFLEHPLERGAAAIFSVDSGAARVAKLDSFAFDRAGSLYHEKRAAANNLGESILGSLGQLHFGWFGGLPVKLAYGLLGLGLTYLAVGGVHIWLARRRDKGRPAPRWERIWSATVWSQPPALAVAALAALLAPAAAGLPLALWGALGLAALGSAAFVPATTLSRLGRGSSGVLLVAIALGHAITLPGDPVAIVLDLILAATGIALVLTLRGGGSRPASPA